MKLLPRARTVADQATSLAIDQLERLVVRLSSALFTATSPGIVPASGGGAVNFLRADGTWQPGVAGVSPTRRVDTALPLTGGGDLSADRTLGVNAFASATSGIVPASGGGTTNFLRADGTWVAPPPSLPGSEWWQDGADGNITFDGSATVLGLVPSGNVYTLTRSIYANNLTVNSSVTIKTAQWQIHCAGTLTNNGIIQSSGAAGSSGGGVNPGISGTYYGGSQAGGAFAGGNGATSGRMFPAPWCATASGGAGSGNGFNPGGNATAPFTGGGGGGGGTGAAGGGGGGGVTVTADKTGPLFDLLRTGFTGFVTTSLLTWGAGGGGGTSGTSTTGASGGAGGGMVYVAARTIAGSGSFEAKGGNGGSASGGGGGGGGGGVVCLVYGTRTGSTSASAAGGTGGTGINNGGNGAAGLVFLINLSGDGT